MAAQALAEQLNGVEEDAWGELCPELEGERLECLEERRQQREGQIAEEQLVESFENIPDLVVNNRQVVHLERNRNVLPRSEGGLSLS